MKVEKFITTHLFKYDETKTDFIGINQGCLEEALKYFAELKCKKLLEIVAKKAKIIESENVVYRIYNTKTNEELFIDIPIDKDSILNAVDLKEFIK